MLPIDDRLSGYPIDLRDEELRGGHTIRQHVGKSEEFLSDRVRREQADTSRARNGAAGLAAGSFTSLAAATRLVNATVSQNAAAVSEVGNGRQPYAVLNQRFDSPTGYEAFAAGLSSQVRMRETDGVRVFVLRDPTAVNGFRVQSAFPITIRR